MRAIRKVHGLYLITLFTFLRSGWSIVRSTSLAKGGILEETITTPP
jgi:hypothetical protein